MRIPARLQQNLNLNILPEGAELASHWPGSGRARLVPDAYRPNSTSSNLSTPKKVIHRQLNIPQNRAKKPRADCLTSVDGDRSYPPIGMPQKQVATPCSHDLKAEFFEETHQFLALQVGKASHTEICWIPTSSRDGLTRLSSKHSSTTSRTRFIRVSRFLA